MNKWIFKLTNEYLKKREQNEYVNQKTSKPRYMLQA